MYGEWPERPSRANGANPVTSCLHRTVSRVVDNTKTCDHFLHFHVVSVLLSLLHCWHGQPHKVGAILPQNPREFYMPVAGAGELLVESGAGAGAGAGAGDIMCRSDNVFDLPEQDRSAVNEGCNAGPLQLQARRHHLCRSWGGAQSWCQSASHWAPTAPGD